MRELNVSEIEQVNGGLTVVEGIGAIGGIIGIAAVAPIVGTVAAVSALGGIIFLTGVDIYNSRMKDGAA
ncbi:hypothetical protein A9Q74_15215 [Colwellia sp. 39_35_sub15_T18]|nr:hypothetical protein A9Q74_15215 [Colwellia sp. 39_35_sub15_T18]